MIHLPVSRTVCRLPEVVLAVGQNLNRHQTEEHKRRHQPRQRPRDTGKSARADINLVVGHHSVVAS